MQIWVFGRDTCETLNSRGVHSLRPILQKSSLRFRFKYSKCLGLTQLFLSFVSRDEMRLSHKATLRRNSSDHWKRLSVWKEKESPVLLSYSRHRFREVKETIFQLMQQNIRRNWNFSAGIMRGFWHSRHGKKQPQILKPESKLGGAWKATKIFCNTPRSILWSWFSWKQKLQDLNFSIRFKLVFRLVSQASEQPRTRRSINKFYYFFFLNNQKFCIAK